MSAGLTTYMRSVRQISALLFRRKVCVVMLFVASSCESCPGDAIVVVFDVALHRSSQPNGQEESDSVGGSLALYLDLSIPMGGYLPLRESEAATDSAPPDGDLRVATQLVASHLEIANPGSGVAWYGIADDVIPLPVNPDIEEALFVGTQSRLDIAVDSVISAIRLGRLSGGAIVTDLLGTGGPPGAATVGSYLNSKWREDAVGRGRVYLALIGVMGAYRGAFSRLCPRDAESFGCWYSEREERWFRMEDAVRTPFYVLLFGRESGATDDIARAIVRDLAAAEVDGPVWWERLTRFEENHRYTMDIDVDVDKSYVMSVDRETRIYNCYRDGDATLRHVFQDQRGFRFVPITATVLEPIGAAFSVEHRGDTLFIDVDCGAVRRGVAPDSLGLEIVGRLRILDQSPTWENWSVPDDGGPAHPGRTLQLRDFVDRARFPDYYLREPRFLVSRP